MSDAIIRSVQSVPVARQQVAPLEFSAEQLKIIRDSFLNGASPNEAAVLLELARVRRLNPITRQIHFVKRNQWDAEARASREVWSAQVGIDGFRAIAERTGLYDGQDEPEFEYDGKQLKLCKVRVYRKDWARPAVGVAHFTEYAQTKKDGGVTKMWAEKPHIMLAKCAEALAFRKAFPEDTSGLYAPEEMGAEREEKDVTPAANVDIPQPKTKALAEKISAKLAPKLPIIDIVDVQPEPAPLPDDFGTGKPLNEITDQQLANQKAFLMKSAGKKAQSKLEAVLAEEERRIGTKPTEVVSQGDIPF